MYSFIVFVFINFLILKVFGVGKTRFHIPHSVLVVVAQGAGASTSAGLRWRPRVGSPRGVLCPALLRNPSRPGAHCSLGRRNRRKKVLRFDLPVGKGACEVPPNHLLVYKQVSLPLQVHRTCSWFWFVPKPGLAERRPPPRQRAW